MNLELIKVVETLDEDLLKVDFLNKTYVYYKSCVSANGRNAMREYLNVIKPGRNLQWPILWKYQDGNVDRSWPVDEFDMYDLLGRLLYYGVENFLIKSYVNETFNEIIIVLDKPQNNILAVGDMKEMLEQLGMSSEMAYNYAQQLRAVQSIWQIMFKRYLTQRQSYASLKPAMNYTDFKENYPNLYNYIKNSGILKTKKRSVKIELSNVAYFDYVDANMRTDAKKEDLCNIVMLHMLHYLLQDSGAKDSFSKLNCLKELRHKLQLPLTFLYYEKVYKPNKKNKYPDIKLLFHRAKNSLIRLVKDSSDSFNIQYLRSHIHNISFNFGNQPSTVRNSYVQQLFDDIPQLLPHNFYYNHLQLLRHKLLTSQKRLEHSTHVMYSSQHQIGYSSTPFYDARLNMVLLPFGILQSPIYDAELHPIFKWSTLGVLMAKTIFHTQSVGKTYLYPPPTERELYLENRIYLYNTQIDLSLARMVGAIVVAYNAYLQNHQDYLQPEFTDIPWPKLFFLNMAQLFCVNDGNTELRRRNNLYLDNITSVLPQFEEAFHCQVETFVLGN
ncbi:uncharacterized protein [Musca autumnalis]|uniref:uncharacterized protein n=1 Tax=Musca autumnalis TaxID=221902 RepID=UPI003CEE2CD2